MGVIKIYNRDGEVYKQLDLTNKNIEVCIGKMTKCILFDGTQKIGYADVFRTMDSQNYDNTIKDYINLWTWKNLDSITNQLVGNNDEMYEQIREKVFIKDIINIHTIRYSGSRWGGKLTNKFEF